MIDEIYSLLLDLEETLIYQNSSKNKDKETISLRPGLESFIDILSQYYELIIFTELIPEVSISFIKPLLI